MLPPVGSSNPAINLSSVLLPQPLGPSRKNSSPAWMCRFTSPSALVVPKHLDTRSSRTDVIGGHCTDCPSILPLAYRATDPTHSSGPSDPPASESDLPGALQPSAAPPPSAGR